MISVLMFTISSLDGTLIVSFSLYFKPLILLYAFIYCNINSIQYTD